MQAKSKAWIFVSHSTLDLEKVRLVRNEVEGSGGEPVLFFLKCLSDHDEIDDLVKREIEARNFFLLCDSKHAKASKWVQDEVEYVDSLPGKQVVSINLDSDWKKQLEGINKILRCATVFLSYAHSDTPLVTPVKLGLIANDYAVWDSSDEMQIGDSFIEQIELVLDRVTKFGYFIHFISRASLSSEWVKAELNRVVSTNLFGDRYVPVLLESFDALSGLLPEALNQISFIEYSEKNIHETLSKLLRALHVGSYANGNRSSRLQDLL